MPASEGELQQFRRRQNSIASDDTQKLVSNMPSYPERLKKIVPEMQQHEELLKDWIKELIIAIRGGAA